jgi:hypothetical protein
MQLPNHLRPPSEERRRYSRERVGHQDFACGLQHQPMRVVHAAQGRANIVLRDAGQTCKGDDEGRLTRANDFVVNEKTEGRILEHGGNVTGDSNGS